VDCKVEKGETNTHKNRIVNPDKKSFVSDNTPLQKYDPARLWGWGNLYKISI